jgi:hypothetical protein
MPSPRAVTSEIIISDRLSDANQRRLPVSNVSCSWELSAVGTLTCEAQVNDLLTYGVDHKTLLSKWIRYRHPTAGPWGGIIQTLDVDNGTLAIGAESWASALRGATTKANIAAGSRMIATLMQQIDLNAADTGVSRGVQDTSISSYQAVDVLPEFDFFAEGQDLLEQFIPNVMQRWYEEFDWMNRLQAAGWNVDPVTRRFKFDSTYGDDLSARAAIRERQHTVHAGWSADTADIINRVLVPSTKKVQGEWVNYMVEAIEPISFAKHGPKTRTYSVDDPGDSRDFQSWANQRATWLAREEQSVTVDVVDESDLFAYVREGDILGVKLTNSRVSGRMVIRSRALTVTTGVMTVSGEAELGL